MLKQMYIVLFVITIGVISLTHGRSFPGFVNDDENQVPVPFESMFTSSQRRFQNEVLRAHNKYRAQHCAQPLRLDDNLSRSAQSYAEQLARTNGMSQSDTSGAGQNMFMKSTYGYSSIVDGREPTTSWYNGIQQYNFNRGGFSMETGSFTQLVWANSRQIGVGIAYTSDGRSAYIIAKYLPPGNFGNQYQENVSPAQC